MCASGIAVRDFSVKINALFTTTLFLSMLLGDLRGGFYWSLEKALSLQGKDCSEPFSA